MSESREHKRRYNERLQYIAAFTKWLAEEPRIRFGFKWHKWKKQRPIYREAAENE